MAEDVRERIQLANSLMTITRACRFIGMQIGDFDVHSIKLYCPFGQDMHEDRGRGKAFRVYPDTNSAYCFACAMPYRPVSLVATDRGVTDAEAAEIILEEVGYVPQDYESRWDDITAKETLPDLEGLSQALMTACSRMSPDWEFRQLEPDVAATLRKCLEIRHSVHTEDEARKWLAGTKIAMQRVLDAPRKETT